MPSWGQLLKELQATRLPNGNFDFDGLRRKYVRALSQRTGRSTIIYYANFLRPGADPNAVIINLGDMQALMEVVQGLPGPNLDLLLHTPGGSPEALESLVRYLRTKYDHIRAFVPLAAMSAGTMWALACDEIVMGKHSQLGPIDPQFPLAFGEQIRLAPAQAVLAQFQKAQQAISNNPAQLAAWVTVLRSYGPSLLVECERAQRLSEQLVSQWLKTYMLRNQPGAEETAASIAKFFADYDRHDSHGRPISREQAREHGVRVTDLEADQGLQDAVLSAHHATMHTLGGTAAAKVIENNNARTFVVLTQRIQVGLEPAPSPEPAPQPPPPRPSEPALNREQRRAMRGRR